jgi:signal transduction histidine kinase/CheY-like chemotaxis protein
MRPTPGRRRAPTTEAREPDFPARWQPLLRSIAEGAALLRLLRDPGGHPIDYELIGLNPAFETLVGSQAAGDQPLRASGLFGVDPPPHLADLDALDTAQEELMFETVLPGPGRALRLTVFELGEDLRGAVITDVSERRRLEQRLEQAQRMEAVGQLAGGVAHDFNNLLTAILGYSELLLSAFDPDDPRRLDVEEIRKAGETATVLNRQLLTFSRREVAPAGPLDLNEVVGEIEKMLGRLLGSRIALILDLAPDLRAVRMEAGHTQQVLLNLVLNARDAMPQGGVLTIETRDVSLDSDEAAELHVAPGRFVALAIRDTGVGIDSSIRPRIFEPFFTTKPAGTGLGLATVRSIVKQAGGAIRTVSEPGAGASFIVLLPATRDPAAPHDRPGLASAPGGTETILVVEDELTVRELSRKVLEQHGYTVMEAHDSETALALARDFPGEIDLVLADLALPGIDGIEVASRLRAERSGLRALYMSGADLDGVARRLATLRKPFTPQDLLARVRQALGAPSSGMAGLE